MELSTLVPAVKAKSHLPYSESHRFLPLFQDIVFEQSNTGTQNILRFWLKEKKHFREEEFKGQDSLPEATVECRRSVLVSSRLRGDK